jgi:DNA polymerase I-like protein with 3'-5' exonuclease and polymerase domains
VTIDLSVSLIPPEVLEAIASCTIVGHNLDFDITVLRRYGVTCSNSIIDTMLASRFLGLGKEKFKVPSAPDDDGDVEEVVNPTDHDLATVVRRYLGIKMDKAQTKLGGSDWGRVALPEAHYRYMREDVICLPDLWKALQVELHGTELDKVFADRMEFAVHLNTIKMTGNPVDLARCERDRQETAAAKESVCGELREIFRDYRHPIPKSRRRKIKVQVEGKLRSTPVDGDEEFSPSNQYHVRGALEAHGIYVENLQKKTLQKNGSPECHLLVKYAEAKKRLEHIEAIINSTFPDGRARPQGWNQLSARTGRITSTGPNLQQVPKNWRTGFRVDPPRLWLKGDLSQIEVVILAAVTGDQNLIGLIQAGKDVYVETASWVFNVEARRSEEDGCVTDVLRDATKPIVLGTSYGLTPFGWAQQMEDELGLEFTLDQAQQAFDEFFRRFPGIAAYHDKAWEDALSVESVRTARGTRRYLPALRDDCNENSGYWPSREYRKKVLLNTPIQGGGADLQVLAVNKFMGRLPDGVEVVNLVHDEVDLILPSESILSPTSSVIRSAFQEAFAELYGTELVPQIKFSVGPGWGDLHEFK